MGELLSDPRPVDAFSLVYDSAPLDHEVAILGRPHALLRASATAPLADWFARLSDVAPDGTVTQITGAGLNGAQRDSMTEPRDLEPGKFYPLDIEMHLTSWVFPEGHRIRVAVSNSLWPMVLPTPYAMTTSLELGGAYGSRIVLPVVPLQERLRRSFLRLSLPSSAPTSRTKDSPGLVLGLWNATRRTRRQQCIGRARMDMNIRGAQRMILRILHMTEMMLIRKLVRCAARRRASSL